MLTSPPCVSAATSQLQTSNPLVTLRKKRRHKEVKLPQVLLKPGDGPQASRSRERPAFAFPYHRLGSLRN